MASTTTTTTTTNTTDIDFWDLYSQTISILNANSLHFFAISLLFTPLTFSLTTAMHAYLDDDFLNLFTLKTLTALVFVIISTASGVALTTYSTHQTILREPVTFTSTIKSLSRSFIPLLTTYLAGFIKLSFIAFLIILLGLGFGLRYDDEIISLGLLCIIGYYTMIWGSAPAIAVLESTSGFEALRQSGNQSPILFQGGSVWILQNIIGSIGVMVAYKVVLERMESISKWCSIVQVGLNYICVLMLFVEYAATHTMLYVQCKALDSSGGQEVTIEEDSQGGYRKVKLVSIVVWLIILCCMMFG